MSLEMELAAVDGRFMATADPDVVRAVVTAEAALMNSGIADRALRAGTMAPPFNLIDGRGIGTSLADLLSSGPAVIGFYRGDWCPYCAATLQAVGAAVGEIEALGARIAMISPQKPRDQSNERKPASPPTKLWDRGSVAAFDYGLAFALPEPLRPVYEKLGHALPSVNGTDDWLLPVTATYVIARNGRIVLSFVDADHRRRLEPTEILSVVRSLHGARLETDPPDARWPPHG